MLFKKASLILLILCNLKSSPIKTSENSAISDPAIMEPEWIFQFYVEKQNRELNKSEGYRFTESYLKSVEKSIDSLISHKKNFIKNIQEERLTLNNNPTNFVANLFSEVFNLSKEAHDFQFPNDADLLNESAALTAFKQNLQNKYSKNGLVFGPESIKDLFENYRAFVTEKLKWHLEKLREYDSKFLKGISQKYHQSKSNCQKISTDYNLFLEALETQSTQNIEDICKDMAAIYNIKYYPTQETKDKIKNRIVLDIYEANRELFALEWYGEIINILSDSPDLS